MRLPLIVASLLLPACLAAEPTVQTSTQAISQTPGTSLAHAAARALEGKQYKEAADLAARALKAEPGNREALAVLHFAEGRGRPESKTETTQPKEERVRPSEQKSEVVLQTTTPKMKSLIPPTPSSSQGYDPVPALSVLQLSASGRTIADFIFTHQIPIKISAIADGAAAVYVPADKTIHIPRDFAKEPLIAQAVILGHEGQHAIQTQRDHASVCLETELDAGMKHRMIYAELVEARIPSVPTAHYLNQQHMITINAIARGNPNEMYLSIYAEYRHTARLFESQRLRDSWPILRPIEKGIIAIVGPYNMTNTRWAAEFKRHWWHSAVAPDEGLAAATRAHQIERGEATKWIEKQKSSSH